MLVMKGFQISKLSRGEFLMLQRAAPSFDDLQLSKKTLVAVADDQTTVDSNSVAAVARTLCRA